MNRSRALALTQDDPMKIARTLIEERFSSRAGTPTLINWREEMYSYEEGVWRHRNPRWFRDEVWLALEDATVESQGKDGSPEWKRLSPTKYLVDSVIDAATVLMKPASGHVDEVPAHLVENDTDLDHCIFFTDVAVDVSQSEEGRYVTFPVDYRVFAPHGLTVAWDEGAECPVWERCMEEWSQGDAAWRELRERFYGYCLMATRKYAKWLLEFGKARGGKGTGTNDVLGRLLRRPSYYGARLDALAGEYGLDGVEMASVLVLSEAHKLDSRGGEKVSSVLKSILGGDELSVNIKYKRQLQHVRMRCAPILQSNPLPQLPNESQGLSSKMLALHFNASFVGREDHALSVKVGNELPGIAKRLVDAAIRLERSEEKWVQPESSLEVVHRFVTDNSPTDAFLDSFFYPAANGWVHGDVVREMRRRWEVGTDRRLERNGMRVTDKALLLFLEESSSWQVERFRQPGRGNYKRGLRGLSLKKASAQRDYDD